MISNPRFSCWVFSNIQSPRTWTLRSGCPKMCPCIKRSWATSSQDCKENAQISNLWDDWCLQGTESSQFRNLYYIYIYYCLCLSGILSISALLHLLIAWFFFDFRSWASCARLRQVGRGDQSSLGRDGLSKGQALCGKVHQHLWDLDNLNDLDTHDGWW